MAVTKILARRGGLAQAIAYVVNGDKTEEQVLTAAQGCSIKSACAEMQDAKIRWNKTDGVQLYHIIQSFRPGEITPGLALEIAQEFVREHLPGYQAVIGVHTDREHIHAHIVFNSVNQLTGEKYHSTGPQEKRWTKQVGTWTTSSPTAAPVAFRTHSAAGCSNGMP